MRELPILNELMLMARRGLPRSGLRGRRDLDRVLEAIRRSPDTDRTISNSRPGSISLLTELPLLRERAEADHLTAGVSRRLHAPDVADSIQVLLAREFLFATSATSRATRRLIVLAVSRDEPQVPSRPDPVPVFLHQYPRFSRVADPQWMHD